MSLHISSSDDSVNPQSGLVALVSGQPVTTSLAIASGVQADHSTVIKLVRTYQDDLGDFGLLDFKSESRGGRPTEYALLNEQQATLLLTYMRNSDIVRAFKKRLVKAFFELRSGASGAMQALSDPIALRGLLLDYSEKVLALQNTVAAQAPTVAAFDRIATASEGALCLRDAAKVLRVGEKALLRLLAASAWIYRRTGKAEWVGYSKPLARGYLEHKVYTHTSVTTGEDRIRTQVLITPKGLAHISRHVQAQLAAPGDLMAPVPVDTNNEEGGSHGRDA